MKRLKKHSNINIQFLNANQEIKEQQEKALKELRYGINIGDNIKIVFKNLVDFNFIQDMIMYYDINFQCKESIPMKILLALSAYLIENGIDLSNFDDEYILHNSIMETDEYEKVIDNFIDCIDQIDELFEESNINNEVVASADLERILNQTLEELRNTSDKNFFEQKIEILLKTLFELETFAFVIEENALINMYITDSCFCEYLKQDILQVFYDYLISENINIELYDENVFAESDIFKNVLATFYNEIISIVEKIIVSKCKVKTASPADQALQGVVAEGRKILQMLENMKFKVEQTARISGNNQQTAQKIMQNSELIDKIMSGLYSVCFGLSSIDIMPAYDQSQINFGDSTKPDAETEKFKLEEPAKDEESEESEGTEETDEQEESAGENEKQESESEIPEENEETENAEETEETEEESEE